MKKIVDEYTIEDSPFFVEYGVPTKQQSFKASEQFEKALKKHLQDKYADEIKQDGKFKYGKFIRKTLEDYLQHQCLERKMFNKSIFAIVSEDRLNEHEDPIINACFVANPSVYYSTKKIDEVAPLFYQVHKVALEDFPIDFMLWGARKENKFLKDLKQYQDAYSSDNIQVLEIPLNNYLDWYHDGIYADRSNNHVHCGANLIETKNGFYGIWYQWIVDYDYSIQTHFIQVVNQEVLLHNLQLCGNEDIYFDYAQILKDKNDYYPTLELSILQNKLERKLNIKSDLEDEIADIQEQMDKIQNKNS